MVEKRENEVDEDEMKMVNTVNRRRREQDKKEAQE